MKYENSTLGLVTKEFENNSRETLLEEIMKQRKIINALAWAMQNAIDDIKKPHSDCTIALDYLEKNLERGEYTDKSQYFNINKNKELKAKQS